MDVDNVIDGIHRLTDSDLDPVQALLSLENETRRGIPGQAPTDDPLQAD